MPRKNYTKRRDIFTETKRERDKDRKDRKRERK